MGCTYFQNPILVFVQNICEERKHPKRPAHIKFVFCLQIDIKRNCHIRSPRETTTDLKPKVEKAWGSPELPIKKIPSQFHEETNILKTPSKYVHQCKSMLNLTNNGSVRITLDNVRSVNHNSTSFHRHETKANLSPRYPQENSLGEYAFKHGSDSKLADTKTWDTGHLDRELSPYTKTVS